MNLCICGTTRESMEARASCHGCGCPGRTACQGCLCAFGIIRSHFGKRDERWSLASEGALLDVRSARPSR
jgi:hypothetical protein